MTNEQSVIRESITAFEFRFGWKLDLDQSPIPDGLVLPHEAPLVYFGYRENVASPSPS